MIRTEQKPLKVFEFDPQMYSTDEIEGMRFARLDREDWVLYYTRNGFQCTKVQRHGKLWLEIAR